MPNPGEIMFRWRVLLECIRSFGIEKGHPQVDLWGRGWPFYLGFRREFCASYTVATLPRRVNIEDWVVEFTLATRVVPIWINV